MIAFIKTLLKWDPDCRLPEEAVLGIVKAYYGCVEAQGRGTLHCHMLIWVEGALNPSKLQQRLQSIDGVDFGKRLVDYLDDIIYSSLPLLPPGMKPREKSSKRPLTNRGCPFHLSNNEREAYRAVDLYELAATCQCHEHTDTCYKYCDKNDPNRTCRFELDEDNVIPKSSIDQSTGAIVLQHLDGLVNNYNPTILEAMRCNMDIKFIGSGEDTKAVIYYVTDYITKSPLKTYISYAALERAVKNFHASQSSDYDNATIAKRLLRKCAFSLTSNQELSAPQVAAYLLGYDDYYTSDDFANLYWTSFERFINDEPTENPDQSECDPASDDTDILDPDDVDADDNPDVTEDEVTIRTSPEGNLEMLSDQLTDYIHRGAALDGVSLWDFVAQTVKVPKS
ncbi:hypothetical protein LXA43DRAFT_886761, partial [Ganoderma leucocontextum]